MKKLRHFMDVCPLARGWKVREGKTTLANYKTQTQAISGALIWVETYLSRSHTVSLRIHRPDGTIREERTYPRSSDPRRTKG